MTIDKLDRYLKEVYSKDTCYPKCVNDWDEENKTLGHCAVVSLIVNEYFGGEIYKVDLENISHYFNYIDNEVIDLTSEQFDFKISYENKMLKTREEMISNKDTENRYNLLNTRLKLILIDEEITGCNLCKSMVEKFPNSKTVSYGKNNDIVILGEAPANNGWRKSGVAWYDVNGKILPSGKILQKLLDEINLKLEEIYFIEAVKCYPINRKDLSKCSENCKQYLFKQLEIIKPKIILTLGDIATKAIIDTKYKKFSDVVGKEIDVKGYKVIPIYHPSPISPMSYKGNIDIFKNLKI